VELLLIRHARPLRVENDDGTPADPPLSGAGRAQAAALADWLEDDRIDRVFASPLMRARETARPLAERRALEIEIEPGVTEFDAEAAHYVPLEELKETDYERWKAFVTGGYGDDRDIGAFSRTVVTGLERIIRDHPAGRVAVVCHGGVINCWAAHVLGLAPQLFLDAMYTSVSRFLASGDGTRSVASLNEFPHLREHSTDRR
jgi:probable phosphoglycerate mutase